MKKDKKPVPMIRILLIFLLVEAVLVVVSGTFSKEIQLGFDEGRFVFRHIPSEYNLQEKITEEFQIDEYHRKHDLKPKIYNSEKIYLFFRQIFGQESAIGTFQLLRMLLIVDLIILLLAFAIRRRLFALPSKPQILFELIYTTFEDFVTETLGKDKAYYTPYIVSLFLFIWICNMVGLIPIPGFMEPTRNINVPLGLGFLAVSIVHISAIKFKGAWHHLQNYLNPVKNPLFVLDIVGEISKLVSISFRLFGNILGGAIIILVVSSLVNYILLPVGLNLFFGIFVGTIQAFVFTMLALTYIGVEIGE
jgi:F-type H+-transporting ATPase subunit a